MLSSGLTRGYSQTLYVYVLGGRLFLVLVLLAGGVPLWAVSPLVVFPPAVFGGCPPPVPLSRVAASFHRLMCSLSLFSGVPAPGRPPGQRHGSGLPGPVVAEQCSMQNGQGLPPRAGSEYEDDLRAYSAGRYVPTAPTDLRAFAAQLDLITASKYEDALRACANMDDLHACIAMMDLFISRMDDENEAREYELLCVQADMNEARELEAQERLRALDEELEL